MKCYMSIPIGMSWTLSDRKYSIITETVYFELAFHQVSSSNIGYKMLLCMSYCSIRGEALLAFLFSFDD